MTIKKFKMTPALRKRWSAALRSGRYKQGHGALTNGSAMYADERLYCCLGVLARVCGVRRDSLAMVECTSLKEINDNYKDSLTFAKKSPYADEKQTSLNQAKAFKNAADKLPTLPRSIENKLIEMNDGKDSDGDEAENFCSFEEIADYIDSIPQEKW